MTVFDPAHAESRILLHMAKALMANMGSQDWATQALLKRSGVRSRVSAIMSDLAKSHEQEYDAEQARQAVVAARKAASARAKMVKVAPTLSKAKSPTVVAPPLSKTHLVRECIPQVLRSTDDVYRRVVALVTVQPITTEKDRLEAVQKALDSFTANGVTAFVDRAGKRWNLTSYLEMATRTALQQSSTNWFAHELSLRDIDLVRVSVHTACAPACLPFQGNLLSLSGATRGPVGVAKSGHLLEVVASLAEARARGYEHPNCKHFLIPFVPGDDVPATFPVDPEQYKHEQKLRARERAVRRAKLSAATALTSERQARSQQEVRRAQAALRNHLAAQPQLRRQRHREQINTPR